MEVAVAQVICVVNDASDVGAARRHAQRVAEAAGFGETDAGRVALIATELANNLVRHAQGGRLLLQAIDEPNARAVEVLSIDSGPGMRDVEQCLRDGYSSGGTSGQGLGAIKRVSTEFDLFTQLGNGCIVMARVRSSSSAERERNRRWRWGAITAPAPGETAIGDCWRIATTGSEISVLVADGLGHGPLASHASEAAAKVFEVQPFGSPKAFLSKAHDNLRATRGAAVAVAMYPGADGVLRYAGAGNISGTIVTHAGTTRGLMSHNGTVGAEMRTVQELTYEFGVGDRLVMHSDGLTSRWSFGAYPGVLAHHPAILSAVLYRDFLRGRDDATVVVMERVV